MGPVAISAFQVGDLPSDSDDMTLEQLAKLKRTDEDADAGML